LYQAKSIQKKSKFLFICFVHFNFVISNFVLIIISKLYFA